MTPYEKYARARGYMTAALERLYRLEDGHAAPAEIETANRAYSRRRAECYAAGRELASAIDAQMQEAVPALLKKYAGKPATDKARESFAWDLEEMIDAGVELEFQFCITPGGEVIKAEIPVARYAVNLPARIPVVNENGCFERKDEKK